MSIKERIKGAKKRTIIAVIVAMVVLVSVPLWVFLQPERPSPAILRERGIEWYVFIDVRQHVSDCLREKSTSRVQSS